MGAFETTVVLLVLLIGIVATLIFLPALTIDTSLGSDSQPKNSERVYCDSQSRNTQACIQIYEPVCGWFKKEIRCTKYPCAETFSNSCFACLNNDVEFYTNKTCPD